MDKKFIGLNAGIIWRIISDQQKWKYRKVRIARQRIVCGDRLVGTGR